MSSSARAPPEPSTDGTAPTAPDRPNRGAPRAEPVQHHPKTRRRKPTATRNRRGVSGDQDEQRDDHRHAAAADNPGRDRRTRHQAGDKLLRRHHRIDLQRDLPERPPRRGDPGTRRHRPRQADRHRDGRRRRDREPRGSTELRQERLGQTRRRAPGRNGPVLALQAGSPHQLADPGRVRRVAGVPRAETLPGRRGSRRREPGSDRADRHDHHLPDRRERRLPRDRRAHAGEVTCPFG